MMRVVVYHNEILSECRPHGGSRVFPSHPQAMTVAGIADSDHRLALYADDGSLPKGHDAQTNVRSSAFEDKGVLRVQSSTILPGLLSNIRPKRCGILFELNKSLDQIVKIHISKRKAVLRQPYVAHQGI